MANFKKIIWAALIIGIIILIKFLVFNNPYNDYKFDSIKWKENKLIDKYYSVRLGMVDDLRKKYLKKELSKDSVLVLLGEPQNNDPLRFEYNLGFPRNRMDPDHLIIFFDYKDKIIKIDIIRG